MRALIQRAKNASVTIDGAVHGQISHGLLILLGVCEGDTEADADYLADKCVGLRIFTDDNDKMNLSCADVGGGLLVVSQFTLYGDCRRGKRPSFVRAARPRDRGPALRAVPCALPRERTAGCDRRVRRRHAGGPGQ